VNNTLKRNNKMVEMLNIEVDLSDKDAEKLEEYDEVRVRDEVRKVLEELASASDYQDELHDRMNIDSKDDEELTEEELKHEVQRFLRGERRKDPRVNR
jgi:hypothetical protein